MTTLRNNLQMRTNWMHLHTLFLISLCIGEGNRTLVESVSLRTNRWISFPITPAYSILNWTDFNKIWRYSTCWKSKLFVSKCQTIVSVHLLLSSSSNCSNTRKSCQHYRLDQIVTWSTRLYATRSETSASYVHRWHLDFYIYIR